MSNVTVNQGLRVMAGTFTLASVALGWFVHPAFFLFTAFVGLNQLQSGFTGWCPAMWMLERAGLRKEVPIGAEGESCCS
ncbi:MAG: DUF2892 domain-containing protein [Polyangiales bacterium]